ncbi:MAG: hypothetical protein ABW277_07950 [Longimicrobiaceae bacterium]
MIPVLLEQAAKTGLLLLAGTLAARLIASRSAAVRHQLWTTVVAAALAVAPLSLLVPDHPVVLLPRGDFGSDGRVAAMLLRARPESAPTGDHGALLPTGPGVPVAAVAAHPPVDRAAPRAVLAVWAAVALALRRGRGRGAAALRGGGRAPGTGAPRLAGRPAERAPARG